jgi:hypothetical protein
MAVWRWIIAGFLLGPATYWSRGRGPQIRQPANQSEVVTFLQATTEKARARQFSQGIKPTLRQHPMLASLEAGNPTISP